MKKETVIAIFLGIFLGVGGAILIIFQSKEKQLEKTIGGRLKATAVPVVKTSPILPFFQIETPDDRIIVHEELIKIKGKATKNSLIVIQSPAKELVFKNKEEEFEIEFPVVLGENTIGLTAYPPEKNMASFSKELHIYYLGNL